MVGVVRVGMIADDMPFGQYALGDIRVKLNVLSDNEEGRFDIVFVENVQYLSGVYTVGAVVKGKGDNFSLRAAPEIDLAEDRRGRRKIAVGGKSDEEGQHGADGQYHALAQSG